MESSAAATPTDTVAAELAAWARRSRREFSVPVPAIDSLAESAQVSSDELIRQAISKVGAPDRRRALQIYFMELFGGERLSITDRRREAGKALGYTSAAMRHYRPGCPHLSPEFQLFAELATVLVSERANG
jgi:hypothetical protein